MTKKIMFIDDDESFLALVGRACERIPHISEVTLVHDGQEAIDCINTLLRAQRVLPNLIFVDINMPRMNGFEFLQEFSSLRNEYPELSEVRPVAMLTSSDEERDRQKAKSLGADEYLVKPASLTVMREILSEFAQ